MPPTKKAAKPKAKTPKAPRPAAKKAKAPAKAPRKAAKPRKAAAAPPPAAEVPAAPAAAPAPPPASAPAPEGDDGKVTVQNVNVPGYTTRVDAAKYHAMREVLLRALPQGPPGLTQAEMFAAAAKAAPKAHWPGGEKVEWWVKVVQLDLEAKGVLARNAASRPIRWFRP